MSLEAQVVLETLLYQKTCFPQVDNAPYSVFIKQVTVIYFPEKVQSIADLPVLTSTPVIECLFISHTV